MKILDDKKLKILLVFSLACMALILAVYQPPQSAPDEGMKMVIVNYIAENGKLPHGDDPALLDATWGTSYGFQPYIPYIIGGLFVSIIKLFTTNEGAIYFAARLPSIIFYILTIVFVIKIAEMLFKDRFKTIFILLFLTIPSIVFTASYTNIDMFAIFTQSLIIYAWILGMNRKWDNKSCIVLGVSVGLCALSYYNAYGYILTSIFFFIYTNIMQKHKLKEIVKKFLLVSAITLAISAWFFIRNAIIYNGDFLALNIADECSEKYALDEFKPSKRYVPANEHIGLYEFFICLKWLQSSFTTLIAGFGPLLNLRANIITYIIYIFIVSVAIVGYLLKFKKLELVKEWKEDKTKFEFDLCMLFNMIIPFLLSFYYSYFSDFQPQGRYLMPMLLPIMYFSTLGLENLITKINSKKKQTIVINTLIIAIVVALLGFIIPVIMQY